MHGPKYENAMGPALKGGPTLTRCQQTAAYQDERVISQIPRDAQQEDHANNRNGQRNRTMKNQVLSRCRRNACGRVRRGKNIAKTRPVWRRAGKNKDAALYSPVACFTLNSGVGPMQIEAAVVRITRHIVRDTALSGVGPTGITGGANNTPLFIVDTVQWWRAMRKPLARRFNLAPRERFILAKSWRSTSTPRLHKQGSQL